MNEQLEAGAKEVDLESEPSAEKLLQAIGRTESKTPGRMRLRVNPEMRTRVNMDEFKANLGSHPDIKSVRINYKTGSVLIEHDKQDDSHELLWEAIGEIELVTEATLEVSDDDNGEDPTVKLVKQLADLSYKIDKTIYDRTGENLHLGLLIPTSIAGIGIAQIAVYGIGLDLLPGPVLVWIAYDIYRRIGKEPPFATKKKAVESTQEKPVTTTQEAEPSAA